VLVGVTVWQNLYLKSFFEVRATSQPTGRVHARSVLLGRSSGTGTGDDSLCPCALKSRVPLRAPQVKRVV
jgi:hypothetical protein